MEDVLGRARERRPRDVGNRAAHTGVRWEFVQPEQIVDTRKTFACQSTPTIGRPLRGIQMPIRLSGYFFCFVGRFQPPPGSAVFREFGWQACPCAATSQHSLVNPIDW